MKESYINNRNLNLMPIYDLTYLMKGNILLWEIYFGKR